MSLQKIIKESVEKNPLGLKEALEEELRNRVSLALEAKMKEEDDMDDDEDDDDDEDQLDEISKKTLGSYVKKAVDSRADASADKKDYKFGSPEYNMLKKTAQKRKAGISKAVDRLAKESKNLDEVDMGQARSVQDRRDSSNSKSGNRYHVVNKNGGVVSSHDNQGDAMRAAMKNDDYRVKKAS